MIQISSYGQRRRDAHADLSLRRAHMSEGTLSGVSNIYIHGETETDKERTKSSENLYQFIVAINLCHSLG